MQRTLEAPLYSFLQKINGWRLWIDGQLNMVFQLFPGNRRVRVFPTRQGCLNGLKYVTLAFIQKAVSTNQAGYQFWVNNPFTKSDKPYWWNTVPVKDVCLMSKLCCRYVTVLIGCEGDEVTVLTNKGVAGLLLKIALLVCLCCRGNERRVQWAAHHVQHLILTLTAHQLTYIPLITHSSLMTVYTAAPHMENNNINTQEKKYIPTISQAILMRGPKERVCTLIN